MEANYPRLYYNYKKISDDEIREYLSKIKLVQLKNKGIGTIHGYYELSEKSMKKILEAPRNVSLTFDAAEVSDNLIEGLQEYKGIMFLVKSTSRFFLKPDIGEVFDQIPFHDFYNNIKAIYVDFNNYETIHDTQGEHFLMIATLLK